MTRAWLRRKELPSQLLTRFLLHSQASLVYLPEVTYISSNSQPVQAIITSSQEASDYFTALMAYHILTKGVDKDFYHQELLSLSNNTATLPPNLAEEIDIQLELLR
ncbi:hypothetical protein [Streptococcus suis]|uniref:hypothetical protein n=1 Tax=Streptococcus suis TaxID=1307 RepID=UPI000AF53F84